MRIYYIETGVLKRQENFNRGIYFFETGEGNVSPALEREVQCVIRLEMGRHATLPAMARCGACFRARGIQRYFMPGIPLGGGGVGVLGLIRRANSPENN
jgi:hypothetical protein